MSASGWVGSGDTEIWAGCGAQVNLLESKYFMIIVVDSFQSRLPLCSSDASSACIDAKCSSDCFGCGFCARCCFS